MYIELGGLSKVSKDLPVYICECCCIHVYNNVHFDRENILQKDLGIQQSPSNKATLFDKKLFPQKRDGVWQEVIAASDAWF